MRAMEHLKVDDELELRLRTQEDALRTFELIDGSRPYLKQWLPWVDGVKTIQDCADFIELNRKNFAEGKDATYGIYYNGDLCGLISYHYFDRLNNKTSLGYWLGEAYQKKGIMSRAVQFLTALAFSHHKMHRVEIHCAVGNDASQSIPKKLGFTHEGILRDGENLYGKYVDLMVFSKLSTD